MNDKARQFVADRRTAYVRTFNSPGGEDVLTDLARFCRAHETTFHSDPRVHAALEGRREVWLRIQLHLKLNDEELFKALGGVSRPQTPQP